MITFHHEGTKKPTKGTMHLLYKKYFVVFVMPSCLREESSMTYGVR